MVFVPFPQSPWGISNVLFTTVDGSTLVTIYYLTLLFLWVLVFGPYQKLLDGPISFKVGPGPWTYGMTMCPKLGLPLGVVVVWLLLLEVLVPCVVLSTWVLFLPLFSQLPFVHFPFSCSCESAFLSLLMGTTFFESALSLLSPGLYFASQQKHKYIYAYICKVTCFNKNNTNDHFYAKSFITFIMACAYILWIYILCTTISMFMWLVDAIVNYVSAYLISPMMWPVLLNIHQYHYVWSTYCVAADY